MIAFENTYKSNEEYSINAMVSYSSYQEYLEYKDRDIKDIVKLMNKKRKQRTQDILEQREIERTINNDKVSKAIEEAIAKIIQEQLEKS